LPPGKIPELRRSIGVVFQDFKLIRRKSALDNVAYVLNVAGISRGEQKRRAYLALKGVGLQHRLNVTPAVLSGGEQQRVAIARAVVNDPELLLADEPTGNLDSRTSVEIMEIQQRLNREKGITVLLITHEHDIAEYGTRVITVRDGRILSDEPVTRRRDAALELAALPPVEAEA